MNPGDLVRFRHAPIFSASCGEIDPLDPLETVRVVGYSSSDKIYIALEKSGVEWKVLGSDGTVGWIGESHLSEVLSIAHRRIELGITSVEYLTFDIVNVESAVS